MGVFDGGTFEVSVRYVDGHEEDFQMDDPGNYVEYLSNDPQVKAVSTCWIHFATGDVFSEFSFGDFWGDEEEEDE